MADTTVMHVSRIRPAYWDILMDNFIMPINVDVAIIGGGPGGATVGALLRKYNPRLEVLILEREAFPRDHVGESQLPVVSAILDEMGVWEKVEAAEFPIKIGATYRWGRDTKLWDFEFLDNGYFEGEPRPGKFTGQRTKTAFQVDRAIYDTILLDHARVLGCQVKEECAVRTIQREADRVTGLRLDDETEVVARHYIDASGHSGILRRAMGVEVSSPTTLQNIAIWDYWRNAEWAVNIGVGGTRIQVLSQPYGWIWFIPLGPDRTSIGVVIPASHYKSLGEKPEDLYHRAVRSDARVAPLLANATCEGKISTTKDWSFLADRVVGENWFLVGESAGFADPILSAGLSLTHMGARDVAYTILALERREFEPEWLRSRYNDATLWQIRQHIRFADYWYTQNGVFSDLKDFAREIAGDAGLEMTSEEAWRWFGQGGFIDHNGTTGFGSYSLAATKHIAAVFAGDELYHAIVGKSHFRLDLEGAEKSWYAEMDNGRITRRRSYRRNGKVISAANFMGWLLNFLKVERSYEELSLGAERYLAERGVPRDQIASYSRQFFDNLEAMVGDGWVVARVEPGATTIPPILLSDTIMHPNRDPEIGAPAAV
jgi:flavin-dependent dehydrogenase